MAHILHKGKKYEIPEGCKPQDVLDSLSAAVPELANATLKKDGENYKAETSFGKKG